MQARRGIAVGGLVCPNRIAFFLALCADFTEQGAEFRLLNDIVTPLLDWYDRAARDLPWRRTHDPYAIWLSEIMCQQTRVQAAIEYYHRFLSELPTVESLATVSEERLLKLWEGLGYYSRARNLQKAARIMCERHAGRVPGSFEELLALPGVGEYTAGAIGSIAFGLRVPCVDGNVLRVITRITADEREIDRGSTRADITREVANLIPADRPGDFNQALMELGATVCLPNGEPLCAQCPLASLCAGKQRGIASTLPRKAPKKERRVEERTVFLLYRAGQVALRRRPDSGLLAGMWEFPSVEGALNAQQGTAWLRSLGLDAPCLAAGANSKHIFSHVEWHMTCLEGEASMLQKAVEADVAWFDHSRLEQEAALASAYRTYKKHVLKKLTAPDKNNTPPQ